MSSTDEQMRFRESKVQEVENAFKVAGVGTHRQHFPGMPYSCVTAYINLGYGGQRQADVFIGDDALCKVFMTGIYQIPEGKTCNDLDLGEIPLLFPPMPADTPNLGETVVRRIRGAVVENSEMIEAKLATIPPPPVPIFELKTLADLIESYEKYNFCKEYSDLLKSVLNKTGKVSHKGGVWEFSNDSVSHSEPTPGSKPHYGPDGEPIVHPSASHIKLAPFLGN